MIDKKLASCTLFTLVLLCLVFLAPVGLLQTLHRAIFVFLAFSASLVLTADIPTKSAAELLNTLTQVMENSKDITGLWCRKIHWLAFIILDMMLTRSI